MGLGFGALYAKPRKIGNRIKDNYCWDSYVQLLRTEAIGLPILELVLYEPAWLGIYMYPVLDYSAINRHRACNLGPLINP